jgi:leader peptidase (prepilin peptidase)/N-methyltransferase
VLGTFVDCDHMIIPDRVTYGGWVAGLVCSPLVPQLHGQFTAWAGFREAVIGLAVGAGLLLLVSVVGRLIFRKDAMGLGDVKLLGGLGALLGWPAVLFIIFVASFLGSFVGIYLIIRRGRRWQSRIPFGPYLAGAAVLWILGGREIWLTYLRWLAAGF